MFLDWFTAFVYSSTSLSFAPHLGQVNPDGFSISSQTDTPRASAI